MDKALVAKMSLTELKEVATHLEIENISNLKKPELLKIVIDCIDEYETEIKRKHSRLENNGKYKILRQIGNKGKEGITYLILDTRTDTYLAMKTFVKMKSPKRIEDEARLQHLASLEGISPKVIEVNTDDKYIVMELLDGHLYDLMKKESGVISVPHQKQLINIFKALDKSKVFHGDSNILNYMFLNDRLYIIDFGMSKDIDDKLISKLKTSTPNFELMTLGLILKLKELKCPDISYSYLVGLVSDENKIKYGL